ncbi:hypothetical protein DFP72DRAFT_1078434 [Ephemerocybe angulata]|uniref:Uncharacterized protein n=1 Tax=Ephemerocybe angulata TaxID=980116 RepID=A0A8H6HCM5_9AGAR|nr:hypothetical protein DFP72DRAFT_1078434 [Tulosesus angulatus]
MIWKHACLRHGLITKAHTEKGVEPPRREWGRWKEWSVENVERQLEARWSDVVEIYSDQSLQALSRSSTVDWKAFLKSRLDLHRSWSGSLPSSIERYSPRGATFALSESDSFIGLLHRARAFAEHVDIQQFPWSDNVVHSLFGSVCVGSGGEVLPLVIRRIETARRVYGVASDIILGQEDKVALLSNLRSLVEILPDVLSCVEEHIPASDNVHRIQVDEKNGFVLTTHTIGGLVVSDIATKEILWCLPKTYVSDYAHLEYEHGYIVFNGPEGSKEVWRSASLPAPPADLIPPALVPTQLQRVACALANGEDVAYIRSLLGPPTSDGSRETGMAQLILTRLLVRSPPEETIDVIQIMTILEWVVLAQAGVAAPGLAPSITSKFTMGTLRRLLDEEMGGGLVRPVDSRRLRPKFVPHLYIPAPTRSQQGVEVPDPTRGSRFVYPHLLAASDARAYIWDVRTGERVQVVESVQNFPVPPGYQADTPVRPAHVPEKVQHPSHPRADYFAGKDADFTLPTFPPFASGYFDENATFSGNLDLRSPAPEVELAPSPARGDPLSVDVTPPREMGRTHYVELGERWVFICGRDGFRAYARGKECFVGKSEKKFDFAPGQTVMRLPPDRLQYGRWSAKLGPKGVRLHEGSAVVRQEVVWDDDMAGKTEEEANSISVVGDGMSGGASDSAQLGSRETTPDTTSEAQRETKRVKLWDRFVAVHVSPDQKHLALLLSSSRLLFIPFFERVVAREVDFWDVVVDIQLGGVRTRSVYLSYGCGESGSGGSAGRIAVVTEGGLFIVTPYLRVSKPPAVPCTVREVDITVHRASPAFMDPRRLSRVSCLQMSDAGIWVSCAPSARDVDTTEDVNRELLEADFVRSLALKRTVEDGAIQSFPGGDSMVSLFVVPDQDDRSREVHQIRFVPTSSVGNP